MTAERKPVHVAIAVAIVAVVATATGLYGYLSRRAAFDASPAAAAVPSSVPGAPGGAASRTAAPSIEVSAERLAQRLRDKDGSGEDWALLARSHVQMRRYPEAVEAFARALEKMPGNAAFLEEQSAAGKAASEGAAPR